MSETGDKVVEMQQGERRLTPFTRKRRSSTLEQMTCSHMLRELVESSRTVECKDCGFVEDAFSYLWRMAGKAKQAESWLAEYNRVQRLRRRAMSEDRSGETRPKFYTERPPETAKKSREVWDRIVSETGNHPPALHRNLKQVMARDHATKIYSSAGVEPGWRMYSVDEWIETQKIRRLQVEPEKGGRGK